MPPEEIGEAAAPPLCIKTNSASAMLVITKMIEKIKIRIVNISKTAEHHERSLIQSSRYP